MTFNIFKLDFFCLVFSTVISIYSSYLAAQSTPAVKITMQAPPSDENLNRISQTRFVAMCYGFTSGRPVECSNEFLYTGLGAEGLSEDCIYTAEGDLDKTSCINGGHTHADNRPQTFDDANPIAFDGDDEDPSVFGVFGVHVVVEGEPSPAPIITVDVSQAAGIYSWNGVLQIETPGWIFAEGPGVQPDLTSYVYEGTTTVGVHGLKQLPDSSDYIKVRSPDESHRDAVAFSGTEEMFTAISTLAQKYNELSGDENYKLSINDLSLPMGGVFDDEENWTMPHKTHREGVDADLNRRPGNASAPIPCSEDVLLRDAAIAVLAAVNSRRPSAVLCEPRRGDAKHLDFTRLLP